MLISAGALRRNPFGSVQCDWLQRQCTGCGDPEREVGEEIAGIETLPLAACHQHAPAQSIRRSQLLRLLLLLLLLHNMTGGRRPTQCWPPSGAHERPVVDDRLNFQSENGDDCDERRQTVRRRSDGRRRRVRSRQGVRKGVRRPHVHQETAGHPARGQLGKPSLLCRPTAL